MIRWPVFLPFGLWMLRYFFRSPLRRGRPEGCSFRAVRRPGDTKRPLVGTTGSSSSAIRRLGDYKARFPGRRTSRKIVNALCLNGTIFRDKALFAGLSPQTAPAYTSEKTLPPLLEAALHLRRRTAYTRPPITMLVVSQAPTYFQFLGLLAYGEAGASGRMPQPDLCSPADWRMEELE